MDRYGFFRRAPHGYRKEDKDEGATFMNALRMTFLENGCPDDFWDSIKHDERFMYEVTARWSQFEEYRCLK